MRRAVRRNLCDEKEYNAIVELLRLFIGGEKMMS